MPTVNFLLVINFGYYFVPCADENTNVMELLSIFENLVNLFVTIITPICQLSDFFIVQETSWVTNMQHLVPKHDSLADLLLSINRGGVCIIMLGYFSISKMCPSFFIMFLFHNDVMCLVGSKWNQFGDNRERGNEWVKEVDN